MEILTITSSPYLFCVVPGQPHELTNLVSLGGLLHAVAAVEVPDLFVQLALLVGQVFDLRMHRISDCLLFLVVIVSLLAWWA